VDEKQLAKLEKEIEERVTGKVLNQIGMGGVDRILAMASGLSSVAHRTFDLLVMRTYDTDRELEMLEHARAALLTALLETSRVVELMVEEKKKKAPPA